MTITRTDADLQTRDAVLRQLDWDPDVEAGGIGVTARDGTVTLTGYADSYAAKLAAERAAKRVRGVRAVANELDVRLKLGRTDPDIAADAARALDLWAALPPAVQAVVHDGHITLTGTVGSLYQVRAAERAVSHVAGVRGVFNHITVASGVVARDVRRRILEAMQRSAELDPRQVDVTVTGTFATLTGFVTTWRQRETAERAAAAAPGISRVVNEILVQPIEPVDDMC